jgi:hypothetical protein
MFHGMAREVDSAVANLLDLEVHQQRGDLSVQIIQVTERHLALLQR